MASGDTLSEVEAAALTSSVDGKPGWKTSEFWLHVVALGVGIFLIAKGRDELGAALIGLSGFGYTAARAVVKR